MNRFTSQPSSRNWTASQSSSSGWLGGSPCEPKSSAVLTSPVPKTWSQNRLTATRAVKGWFGATSHCARPSRLSGAPGRRRRQEGRRCPADLVAPLVVLAAVEQERRLRFATPLAEDQGCRNLAVDLAALLLGLRQLGCAVGRTRIECGNIPARQSEQATLSSEPRFASTARALSAGLRPSGSPAPPSALWARIQAVSESYAWPSCGVQVSMPARSQ